uniref:Uncharacterized protein n=1 Tax=Triticum urartu TaxID=4572 RepID=A0A8R7QLF8_TRIUA
PAFRGSAFPITPLSRRVATPPFSPAFSSSHAAVLAAHPLCHVRPVPRTRMHLFLRRNAGLLFPAPSASAAARSGRSAECRPECLFLDRESATDGCRRESGWDR